MRASRTDDSRLLDYSAVSKFDGMKGLQNQIARRVGKHANGMTVSQLQRWFAATPPDFVLNAIHAAASNDMVVLDHFRVRRESKSDMTLLRYKLPLVLKEVQNNLQECHRDDPDRPYAAGYAAAITDTLAAIDSGKVPDGY